MKLILCTRHHISSDGEEHELVDERFLEVDLDLMVRKDALAFYQESAYLRLSDNVPPVFTILNNVLYHFIVIRFKLIVFLVSI